MPGRTPDRTRRQIWAESALAAHPHRLELRGSLRDLSWPQICAYCGEPAAERIVVTKAFRPLPGRHGRSTSSGLRAYRIGSAAVPFCPRCTADHRATVQHPSIARQALRLILNPLIIPVAGFLWLTTVFWSSFRTSPGGSLGPIPEWGVLMLLAAAIAWCVYVLWESTAAYRIEPQTEITRACDFSEGVGGFLEKERRIYAMRNQAFADAMAALNANRIWTHEDQARSTKLGLVFSVLVLAGLAGIVGLLKLLGY